MQRDEVFEHTKTDDAQTHHTEGACAQIERAQTGYAQTEYTETGHTAAEHAQGGHAGLGLGTPGSSLKAEEKRFRDVGLRRPSRGRGVGPVRGAAAWLSPACRGDSRRN